MDPVLFAALTFIIVVVLVIIGVPVAFSIFLVTVTGMFYMVGEVFTLSMLKSSVFTASGLVKAQAEAEGLDMIFRRSGFEWREAGCSMCLAMNGDVLQPGERCASTSNRNFEHRQGSRGRTHLVSPAMAAAAAIRGCFTDVRDWPQ